MRRVVTAMGGRLCCCCSFCYKKGYIPILHDEGVSHVIAPVDRKSSSKKTKQASSSSSGVSEGEASGNRLIPTILDFDMSLPVFSGLIVDQKYSTYSYYDKKFIWVCPTTRTLHMSQFETKDRRHKEANLSDIQSIESIPPLKFKKGSSDDQDINSTVDIYLSIKFSRGGGVDFRFRNPSEKNEFLNFLQLVTKMSRQIQLT